MALRRNNLAELLRDRGDCSAAEPLLAEAVAAAASALGPTHSTTALYVSNLAGVQKAQGRWADAEANYRRAADIDCANLGEGHPDCAIHWNNLGSVFQVLQQRTRSMNAVYEGCL